MSNPYTLGPSNWRKVPRFETKPSTITGETWTDDGPNLRRDSGGGYERVRSTEHDPTNASDGKTDVYAYVHRLCAVAWCIPEDVREDFLGILDGKDVHHESRVEWLNCHESPNLPQDEFGITVMDHGRHSEVTQAQMRAWAADAKREQEGNDDAPAASGDACDRCGDAADVLTESADWEGRYCVPCSKDASDGAPIEVL